MKTENKKFYIFFKGKLEELLKQGFSKEQAFTILNIIHKSIDEVKGYHYTHHCYSAGESLKYLIQKVQEQDREQELKEHILDNAITYGLKPEEAQDRAIVEQMEA